MQQDNVYISAINPGSAEDAANRLISRAKQGDEAALSEIYNLYFKRIYGFIFLRVGHKELAEDLAENVFLKAYGKLAGISQNHSFEGWLYQIARNEVIDYYRQKKLIISLDEVENTLEYETNIIDIVNLEKQQQLFLKVLRELSPEQQVVIKLKFFEDLTNTEIAEMLDKTETAVRVIQHRSIKKLQELIQALQKNNE